MTWRIENSWPYRGSTSDPSVVHLSCWQDGDARRPCEISSGKSSSILRIAPTLLQATSSCSDLLNILFQISTLICLSSIFICNLLIDLPSHYVAWESVLKERRGDKTVVTTLVCFSRLQWTLAYHNIKFFLFSFVLRSVWLLVHELLYLICLFFLHELCL
jgi:hypothetical protein